MELDDIADAWLSSLAGQTWAKREAMRQLRRTPTLVDHDDELVARLIPTVTAPRLLLGAVLEARGVHGGEAEAYKVLSVPDKDATRNAWATATLTVAEAADLLHLSRVDVVTWCRLFEAAGGPVGSETVTGLDVVLIALGEFLRRTKFLRPERYVVGLRQHPPQGRHWAAVRRRDKVEILPTPIRIDGRGTPRIKEIFDPGELIECLEAPTETP